MAAAAPDGDAHRPRRSAGAGVIGGSRRERVSPGRARAPADRVRRVGIGPDERAVDEEVHSGYAAIDVGSVG